MQQPDLSPCDVRADDDQRLRDDVSRLGRLLGDTLAHLEGRSVFAHVELARRTARDRRDGVEGAAAHFEHLLHGLSCEEAMAVSRAFSSYFQLVNLAERGHRVRLRRARVRHGAPLEGSFESVLARLRDAGFDETAMQATLDGVSFKPVFTAHPTEAVRRTLLIKEQRIAEQLFATVDAAELDEAGRDLGLELVRDEVALAWQTDEHFSQPSVADEVEHVLFYLSNVLYLALPGLERRLQSALRRVFGPRHGLRAPGAMVRFGSWVGADMDGNPNVGASTIVSTLERQRQLIIERYRREVRELFDHLSHGASRVAVAAALKQRIADALDSYQGVAERIPSRYRDMPYRMFMWIVWHRLGATLEDTADGYRGPDELLGDLNLVLESLAGHGDTGARRVRDLALRVRCFGFHLAALDVRQDAAVHRRAVAEALARPDFERLEARARTAILREALAQPAPAEQAHGPTLDSTIDVMRAIGRCLVRFGPRSIGLYIVSMARDVDDALAVLYLARLAGHGSDPVALDVAPLFETVDDLEQAPGTLAALLDDAVYGAHLATRGERQYVMLGYSDSNKQAGIAASRFALHRAQTALVRLARARPGLGLTLFHGRGGSISRGGGETRNGVLAEPPGALGGRLRVTEQGEIIGQKYGMPDVAIETMELALGALMERRVAKRLEPAEGAPWMEIAAQVARASREAYAGLLEHPDLVPYFRAATPIDVIERLRIGSRPPSRNRRAGVGGLRAIPWVFAWAQSRHSLTGWYGLGHGLEAALDAFGADALRAMAREWRFFAGLLSDAEMVLAKSDMGIARLYASLAGDRGEVMYALICDAHERTRRTLCTVLAQDRLLEHKPQLARTLRLRDPYVDPLHLVQVDFLGRWREGGRNDEDLERVLAETVRGIARGIQNTG